MIFGRVIEGMELLREIECIETTNERPNENVRIFNSGLYTKVVK